MSKVADLVSDETKVKLQSIATDAEIIETALNIPFSPIDGRVLVKPLDEVKVVKVITVPDDEANEGKTPEDVQETKDVEEEVISNLRVGVILAIAEDNEYPFKVGDQVVFVYRAAMPFDLFKDSVLLKRYDILGLWLK